MFRILHPARLRMDRDGVLVAELQGHVRTVVSEASIGHSVSVGYVTRCAASPDGSPR